MGTGNVLPTIRSEGASPSSKRSSKRSSFFSTTRLRQRLKQEMRLLARLRHPGVVTVMGAVLEVGMEPLMVMERMEMSLYQLLSNDQVEAGVEIVVPVLRDITSAMIFLHAHKPMVLHGDIKSMNVLVDQNFRGKLSDFGLSGIKQNRKACGSPPWMSPELLRGGSTSPESDVYAFGILLAECLNRELPYQDDDMSNVLMMVGKGPDEDGNLKRPTIKSDPTEGVLTVLAEECWHEDPSVRPPFTDIDRRLRGLNISCVGATFLQRGTNMTQQSSVLHEMFPPHIVEKLKRGVKVEPEDHFVSIFFSDIVGFTNISAQLSPAEVADMLDRLYTQMDGVCHRLDLFKQETIGDAMFVVGNLKRKHDDHLVTICEYAQEVTELANATPIHPDRPELGTINIRVGIHCGPVVSNVVGTKNPRFCLFGDTVNTASRMESNSIKNHIHLSGAAAKLLKEQSEAQRRTDMARSLHCRGKIEIKGKGGMVTYWLLRPEQMERLDQGISPDDFNKLEEENKAAAEQAAHLNKPRRQNSHRMPGLTGAVKAGPSMLLQPRQRRRSSTESGHMTPISEHCLSNASNASVYRKRSSLGPVEEALRQPSSEESAPRVEKRLSESTIELALSGARRMSAPDAVVHLETSEI